LCDCRGSTIASAVIDTCDFLNNVATDEAFGGVAGVSAVLGTDVITVRNVTMLNNTMISVPWSQVRGRLYDCVHVVVLFVTCSKIVRRDVY
jgi:hypothetical protein